MRQGSSWIYRFIMLALVLPACAMAETRVMVSGMHDSASDALAALLGDIGFVRAVASEQDADILVVSSVDALSAACTHGKPVILMDAGIAVRDAPVGCQWVRIVMAASIDRQLGLMATIMTGAHRVGVLYSPSSRHLLPVLRRQLADRRMLLVAEQVSAGDQLGATLADLMADVDVLLALPDVSIYNANNARQLLMTAYRQGKPIIGPDDHWVRAGSLASAYVTSDQLQEALSATLQALQRGEPVAQRVTPGGSLIVNGRVAEAFGISVPAALEHAVSGERR